MVTGPAGWERTYCAGSCRRRRLVGWGAGVVASALWISSAITARSWVPIGFGIAAVVPIVSSGYQRLVVDEVGLTIHRLFFLSTRASWDSLLSIEFPTGGIWRVPIAHLKASRSVTIMPLAVGRFEYAKGTSVERVVEELNTAIRAYRHQAQSG